MTKYTKKGNHSSIEKTLDVIESKWTVLVILEIISGVQRFSELTKSLRGISPRTLSLRLSSLEKAGIISRRVFPEVPPRVEYTLTPLGRTLEPVLSAMEKWGSALK